MTIDHFGLGGVRVPIIFGNDLLWNDLPYLKGFVKVGCLEPSKERRLTQFLGVPSHEILVFLRNFIYLAKQGSFI